MSKTSVDLLINKLLSSGVSSVAEIAAAGMDLSEVGSHGRTLLMAAASEGLYEAVEALVKLGASVSVVGTSRMTALHEASANGHTGTALRLLERGAAVDAETDDGVTPFMCAAAWGHVEVAKLLLSQGADRTHVDKTGASAADIACEKGEQAFVEFLDSQEEKDR